MGLCGDRGPLDIGDTCIRASWATLVPAIFVVALCFFSIPTPSSIRKLLKPITNQFDSFLTLHEAEALDIPETPRLGKNNEDEAVHVPHVVPLWRAMVFAFVGTVEALSWLARGSYLLYEDHGEDWWRGARCLLYTIIWLYTVIRPISRPTATPPYDIFVIYLLLLGSGILELGGYLYDYNVYGFPLPVQGTMTALWINLVVTSGLLVVILKMPLDIPSNRVKKEDIGTRVSSEDYTSLWGWVTFSWVYPLVYRGRYSTLNEEDVWDLSPTMQSRPVFIKFSEIKRPTLLRKLWAANSFDLIMDFSLTYVSIAFNYTGPFFMKRILDEIDRENPTRASKSRAYIYAFLAFACTLAKAQADVQHLWFGRRAATRLRSELMAAIYDKALKRKDYSGIIDKNKAQEVAEEKAAKENDQDSKKKNKAKKKADKEKEAKADDPKAGADVGKIVNLMAGDANRITQTISAMYFLYGAPFEIVIASIFLYNLLGWSAFAGFIILVIGWPLNNFVAKRSVRIQKGVLASRDKRMSVLNELIGAVKFIKFFAWEDRWIERALDAREVEMKWMIKSRFNSVMFYILWTCAPIFVSIVSFCVYVLLGNELTISVAFTAIALFNMIRMPLNVIPAYIVQVLQTGVALKRIAVYLEEEEVSEQVSSLKKDRSGKPSDDLEEGLGFVNASFVWNAVPEEEKEDTTGKGKSPEPSTSSTISNTLVDNASASTATIMPSDFTTPDEDHRFELRDLNIRFPEGYLTVVTGPTASGKTALLMALLGEMTATSGRTIMDKETSKVDENGLMYSISYAAQSPWLRHQSIRDNILFGYPYDEERYNEVIEACALKPDLDVLEDGDATEIGARGVSLSGGQKARVALARAVYARTRSVLLDDPLSAVDSHTSRYLYENLLRGPLLANRTVILVTHHIELVIPGAHYLIRMLDGRIDTHGTVRELRAQGILDEIAHDAVVEVEKEKTEVVTSEALAAKVDGDEEQEDAAAANKKKPRKLIKDEHRETGGVKWSIYKSYLKASSYWTWVILAALIVVVQLLGLTEKLWIMIWGDAYKRAELTAIPYYIFKSFTTSDHDIPMEGYMAHHQYRLSSQTLLPSHLGREWPDAITHPYYYISIYATIGLLNALTGVLSVIVQYTGALRASRILFKKLLVTVVRATFRFHDTTPQGRMLNRFGKDIETIDVSLAGSLQAVNSSLASFFAAILTVAYVFPGFLIPAVFIGFIYRELAIGYLNTGRDLRRMESNSRSPIFSDFGELLEGIVTVRAFSAENRFLNNLHKKIDVTTKMWYSFWMTNRWLLLNFDTLGGLAVLITSLFSIATLTNGAGFAALCITSAMAFTMSVYWACRFWTALELDLNSVERISEYLELPQEPPAIIESNRVPAYWPSSSNNDSLLVVEDLTIKYAPDLPAVLQDINFSLRAGERVGLLGRTGSGKSTLAMSILRFVDPASGKIIIDGIDISKIGIHDLRSRITFIPQDATLFSGTLRDNLDPFNEHTDADCLDVLQRVHMIGNGTPSTSHNASQVQSIAGTPSTSRPDSPTSTTNVATTDNGSSILSSNPATEVDNKTKITLDTQVSAGGTNFSQGQRQLIAMARALLRRSAIIVLDEATSSIDFATDAKIQRTIREEFKESLLLTVAHRLKTVIDYDRLVVLDKGKMSEFDTPWNLMQKEGGIFRTMCLKSGSFADLEAAAKAKAEGLQTIISPT